MTLGFIFPGQGSQSVGMLSELAAERTLVRDCFEEAGEVIGQPLWDIVSAGPEAMLNTTAITQPALLTASVALWRLWSEAGGPEPVQLAGHSLGEYSALVCSGALSFDDGVALAHERGRLMQSAVAEGDGAMAAILGLTDEQVVEACSTVTGIVAPANFNAPGQVVIAGASKAVGLAIDACKSAGARRAVLLAVSVPAHSTLMAPALEEFSDALERTEFQLPGIPVIQNVDAEPAVDVASVRDKLLKQMTQPVQWTRCVETLLRGGATVLMECGPGKVLAGLVKRISKSTTVMSLNTPDDLAAGLEAAGLEAAGHGEDGE